MTNPFKAGDKVVVQDREVLESYGFTHGKVYTVLRKDDMDSACIRICNDTGEEHGFYAGRFRRAPEQVFAKPAMILATDPAERKDTPITSGVLDYFPRALAAVARCSKAGNDQHNPGQPLHWAKGKSTDHADCVARHLIDRKAVDTDGIPHSWKLAWRALALLETELEAAENANKA